MLFACQKLIYYILYGTHFACQKVHNKLDFGTQKSISALNLEGYCCQIHKINFVG